MSLSIFLLSWARFIVCSEILVNWFADGEAIYISGSIFFNLGSTPFFKTLFIPPDDGANLWVVKFSAIVVINY